MLRNKKYGMGGAVQSFSSPMLAQGMQGGLSGFGTSGVGMFAKGGEIIDQYEGRIPADIWFNLTKSQRRHLLLDHANIPSGELSSYIGDDTSFDELPHFVKQIVKKHFAEGQYAKGGQIATIGDSGIITDKNSMFVGKMALITGDLGNMCEVRVGERTTIVKKNGIRIISDEYAHGGEIHNSAKQMSDEDFEIAYNKLTPSEKNEVKSLIRLGDDKKLAIATILAESKKPSSSDFYKQAYEYAEGGKTRKSGNVPRIAKKVAEVNALIEKGNELGVEVVDSSTTWQAPMKYKPIKYVNGILYIEYQELDLYSHLKRGVNQWKLKKDKVLKRNMDFDNPLNDIAKMYRKAIREREQYFADGGKTRKSGNVPRIAKKVAEVNALIEKGNSLGLEVVDTSTTWQSPMKYKPIKYVNGILYIEYEKLDLYALSKRGVQKWDIQKDKVLKRNMEFDNPLNDIAKMYRKAIREREQYFADGGNVQNMDRYSSARTMGRDSQNWESELKEYAGEHYKNLTPRERAEIIADMQRGYDRNSHFADGGEITHLPESRKVSKEEIEQFIRYVDSFYGKQGIYADMLDGGYTKSEIRKAVMTYLNKLDSQQTWGGGDSLDRERIKEILHQTYARGGQTKPKTSRITLIMDGQKYSYPVALVNGRVEVTEETFKDGVVREYLDKEFDLWLQQAPTDYEEMYYGDEDVMSKSGAIEGAMEIVISTIEQEAPKKTTFNFDEGDVEFYEAYQYARGGSIAVSDDEKRKSLKGNLKIKF